MLAYRPPAGPGSPAAAHRVSHGPIGEVAERRPGRDRRRRADFLAAPPRRAWRAAGCWGRVCHAGQAD
eukprot:15478643-Alexandrium_andersonii.AAC.1